MFNRSSNPGSTLEDLTKARRGAAPDVQDVVVTTSSRQRAVEHVIQALRDNIDDPPPLQALASIALFSQFHFDRVFRDITGIAPFRFLSAIRMERAKHLLLTTSLTVTDICFEVGYSSLGTFTSQFTYLTGVSPSALRRRREVYEQVTLRYMEDLNTDRIDPVDDHDETSSQVSVTSTFRGLIFVGAFAQALPAGPPVACCLVDGMGSYRLPRLPDGQYVLLAIGIQRSTPTALLLPETCDMYVGRYAKPLLIRAGRPTGHADLVLRPVHVTDPPVLLVLPHLLALHEQERFGRLVRAV